MNDARGQARRSVLLTGLSYPLLVIGLVLLFTAITVPGAVLATSGVFLIEINELVRLYRQEWCGGDRAPLVSP